MKRKILNLSEEIFTWYHDKAKSMGIPMTALMVMAMSGYMDQHKGLEATQTINKLMTMAESGQLEAMGLNSPQNLVPKKDESK